jgi:hypothetical protein
LSKSGAPTLIFLFKFLHCLRVKGAEV